MTHENKSCHIPLYCSNKYTFLISKCFVYMHAYILVNLFIDVNGTRPTTPKIIKLVVDRNMLYRFLI